VSPERAPTLDDFLAAFDLFRDAVLCGAIGGAVLGFLSVYVVLRRMVFVSAAVTQAAGLGVALAFYAEIHLATAIDPAVGAAALALATTLLLAVSPERIGLTREGLLGLVFALSGGAAVLVGDRIAQEAHDIQAILFGTAVLVRPEDLHAVAGTAAAAFALHLALRRGLVFAAFDPVSARVQGLPVALLDAALLVSIGATVGVTARALGALPVFALSTLPAMAATLLGLRLGAAFAASTALGAACGAGGYALAFFWELPVGASQTTLAGAMVVCAALVPAARRA
jgi:zinc transport system permease protein